MVAASFESRTILLLALLATGSLVPSTAHAQDKSAAATKAENKPEEEVSPARALFQEGRTLAAEGNYAAACPKFEESLRLESGVGVQFNLANCYEHVGKIASAHALFIGAAASAKAAGQADREQVLRERAAALEVRLVRLVIESAEQDPKLVVKRDDLPLDALGRATPVDPGSYVISAKAPNKKPWTKTVEVKADSKVVTVEIPKLEPAEPLKPAAKVPPKAEKRATAAPPPSPSDSKGDRQPLWRNYRALALGGFGVVSLGVGTVFAVRFKSANDDAKSICPSSVNCTISEIQEHDRLTEKAKTSRGWTYAGFGVGAAALGGAVALIVFDRPAAGKPSSGAVRALPLVGESGELGAALSGSF